MYFDLKSPCGECPFRSDKPHKSGWLGKQRAEQIYDTILSGKTFICHKTLDNCSDKEQFCAGALIILEKQNLATQSQSIRMGAAFGWYDPKQLKLDAPVFDNRTQFVRFHANLYDLPIFKRKKRAKLIELFEEK